MSEFLNEFFAGALGGAILCSASMVVKTLYETTVEKARERAEKARELDKKARCYEELISLLEEKLSQLEE